MATFSLAPNVFHRAIQLPPCIVEMQNVRSMDDDGMSDYAVNASDTWQIVEQSIRVRGPAWVSVRSLQPVVNSGRESVLQASLLRNCPADLISHE